MMIAKRERGPVVVPWAFTSASRVALTTALDLIDGPGQLHVVHIADRLSQGEVPVLSDDLVRQKYHEYESRFREQFCQCLPANSQHLGRCFHVAYGRVAPIIAAFAKRQRARLIVLSSDNRWSLSRFVFGSLTSKIVHAADCPVLVLKGLDDRRSCVPIKKVKGGWGGRISDGSETV